MNNIELVRPVANDVTDGGTIAPGARLKTLRGRVLVAAAAATVMLLGFFGLSAGAHAATTTPTAISTAILAIDSPTAVPANGTASHTLSVTALDAAGNPVAGASVTFATTPGATLSSTSGVTNSKGEASAQVAATDAGSYSASAYVVGFGPATTTTNSTSVPANFTASASSSGSYTASATPSASASADLATLSVDSAASVAADGTASHTVTVKVVDANGNPVAGASVTFNVTGNALLSSAASVTNGQGEASAKVTADAAGSYDASAFVGDIGVARSGSGSVSVPTNFQSASVSVSPDGNVSASLPAVTAAVNAVVAAVQKVLSIFHW